MNKPCVVIGDNHHNTLGVIRSLGEMNLDVHALILGHNNHLIKGSRYLKSLVNINHSEIIEYLISNFSELHPIIYTCCDLAASIIDNNYDVLIDDFSFFNAGQKGRINFYLDKGNMQRLAEKCGLLFPKTCEVTQGTDLRNMPIPCMIKPLNSLAATKSELKKINTSEELMTSLTNGITYQLQEFIDKDFELSIVACSMRHGKEVLIPGVIRKIREYPFKKGSSSFAVLEDLSRYPFLDIIAIKRFMSELKYEGLFSIEFLCKDNKAYFLEVNMRNDGNGYVPTGAGVNLPFAYYKYVCEGDYPKNTAILPSYFMSDFTDILYVLKGKLSIINWLKSWRIVNTFLVYNLKDRKPFFHNLKAIFKQIWNRI